MLPPKPLCWSMVAMSGVLAGCATRDTNTPTGPTSLVMVTLQPARIPPNEQGALLLSAATGCYVEYVGKGGAETVYRFRLGPTQRIPELQQCLASLRRQPGITGVQPGQ